MCQNIAARFLVGFLLQLFPLALFGTVGALFSNITKRMTNFDNNFDDTIQWHWQQKENWLIQSKKAWGQNKGKDRSHKTAQVPGGRYLQCPAKSLQIFIFKGDHSSASGVTKNLKAVNKIYFHDRNCKLGCQFSILLNGTPKSTLRQHKLNIERAW